MFGTRIGSWSVGGTYPHGETVESKSITLQNYATKDYTTSELWADYRGFSRGESGTVLDAILLRLDTNGGKFHLDPAKYVILLTRRFYDEPYGIENIYKGTDEAEYFMDLENSPYNWQPLQGCADKTDIELFRYGEYQAIRMMLEQGFSALKLPFDDQHIFLPWQQ